MKEQCQKIGRYLRVNGGQSLLQVVMWATGISVGLGMAIYSGVSGKIEAQDEKIYTQVQDVAQLKAKIERLPVIEDKIDVLLRNTGVNPKNLE